MGDIRCAGRQLRYPLRAATVLSVFLSIGAWTCSQHDPADVQSTPERYAYLRTGDVSADSVAIIRSELPFDSIALERTACFGPCPVYTVMLRKNGEAEYRGSIEAPRSGNWSGRIGLFAFGRISHLIEMLQVLDLPSDSVSSSTDAATAILRVWPKGQRQAVMIRDEGERGPTSLWAVREAIDAAAYRITWRPKGTVAARSRGAEGI